MSNMEQRHCAEAAVIREEALPKVHPLIQRTRERLRALQAQITEDPSVRATSRHVARMCVPRAA